MVKVNQPLTTAQAERFSEALQSLRAGQPARALALARELARETPDAADAQQLLGISSADAGAPAEAEAAFRRALELAPGSEVIILNFAAWLRKQGRLPEAAGLLASLPESALSRTQQGLLAQQMRDYRQARAALRRAVELQADSVNAWYGLGNAERALGDPEAAEIAFRQACILSPGHAPAWFGRGAALRLLGRLDDAMSCFRQAEALGYRSPDLQDAINGLLADLAAPAEALRGARALLRAHPEYAQGHETYAGLLWEYGPGLAPAEDPLGAFRAAVQAQPGNQALTHKYLRVLLAARRPVEALSVIRSARPHAQDIPLLDWIEAEARDALGQHAQAAALFSRIYRSVSSASPEFLNAYARHAFRAGRIDQAQVLVHAALTRDPDNQEALCHLGTLWRLANDEREHWLCDYERLIGCLEVPPPAGHGDMDPYLDALAAHLNRLHSARREPVNQSVRNGSQTAGRLFGRSDPVIAAAQAALQNAVEHWAARLPDDSRHPFLSRKRAKLRMTGSWSVKLWSSGRHANHFHSEGWASSAYYVALPDSVRQASGNDLGGCIQFGQPLDELGLKLPPRRVLRPRPGYLVLFPSYFWHGTVPFSDAQPRLTIAFDIRPTD